MDKIIFVICNIMSTRRRRSAGKKRTMRGRTRRNKQNVRRCSRCTRRM